MTPLSIRYPISIAILYSTSSPETPETMAQMVEALEAKGHLVNTCEVSFKNLKQAVRTSGDVVINLVEDDVTDWRLWKKTADLLEFSGRAQLGYGLRSGRYSLQKRLMKRRLLNEGLNTPRFRLVRKKSKLVKIKGLEYPLIVKPAAQHASVGISQESVVIDSKELEQRIGFLRSRYDCDVLVEEFVDGREFHITVLGNNKHTVALPFTEIDFRGEYSHNWNVYTYEAKWKPESWEYWASPTICPVKISKEWDMRIDKLVLGAYKALDCRDVVRFDVRVDAKGRPFIIDFNASPDLSCANDEECWLAASSLGWSYADFIETLVAICYKRVYKRLPAKIRARQLLLES